MPSWSHARLSLIAVCALPTLACAGGTNAAKRADSICTREAVAIRAAPDPATRITVAHREVRELRALHAAKLKPLVGALTREVDDAFWLRIAGLSGDSEMGEAATNLGRRAAHDAKAAARTAGVTDCA